MAGKGNKALLDLSGKKYDATAMLRHSTLH